MGPDTPIEPWEPDDSDPISFKEKLKTLHFGIVPGGYRDLSSKSMIDAESLAADGIPTREEVLDRRSTALRKIRESE